MSEQQPFVSSTSVQSYGLDRYLELFPKNCPVKILEASAYGFVIGTLLSSSFSSGGASAVLCAVATLIHALISPLFKEAIGNQNSLPFTGEWLRGSVAIIATAGIAAAFGSSFWMNTLLLNVMVYAIRIAISPIHSLEFNDPSYTNAMIFPTV